MTDLARETIERMKETIRRYRDDDDEEMDTELFLAEIESSINILDQRC